MDSELDEEFDNSVSRSIKSMETFLLVNPTVAAIDSHQNWTRNSFAIFDEWMWGFGIQCRFSWDSMNVFKIHLKFTPYSQLINTKKIQ